MNKKIVLTAILLFGVGVGAYVFQMNESANSTPVVESSDAETATAIHRIEFELRDVNGNLRQSSEWDGKEIGRAHV